MFASWDGVLMLAASSMPEQQHSVAAAPRTLAAAAVHRCIVGCGCGQVACVASQGMHKCLHSAMQS